MNTLQVFFFRYASPFILLACSVFGKENISIKLEIERALGRGVEWINSEQNSSSGQWGEAEYPALTALACAQLWGIPDLAVVKKYAEQQARVFPLYYQRYNPMVEFMEKV
jgi:hypothetical protein